MEHIWQSSQEHTPGSFDVTENIPGLRPPTDLGGILTFPVNNSVEESVPVCRGLNLGNLEEDFPEPSGIGGFGRGTAPGQALPLYMDQASLHNGIWPELTDDSYHIRVTIHRKAKGTQSSRNQTLKEFQQLRLRIFGDTVLTSYNHAGSGIHQGNKAAWAVQERAIEDEVLAFSQTQYWLGYQIFQMIINHAIKFPRAVSALAHQLSNRVTFHNPQPEPFLFFGSSVDFITPATRVPTRPTEPTLFSFSIVPVSPKYV